MRSASATSVVPHTTASSRTVSIAWEKSAHPIASKKKSKGTFIEEAPPSRGRRLAERIRERSRVLSDSWRFNVLTTVLTVYALFGDDFRLAATHQAIDNLFNVITVFCILVFSTEVVAASLGKEEYFLGFFFLLDVGATVTLLFDLTWVWNQLACGSDDGGGGGALKTSRAGRAGARAARTVRIIRLLRLVKLYKTYKTALEQKDGAGNRRGSLQRQNSLTPGEEDDDDLLTDDEDQNEGGTPSSAQASKSEQKTPAKSEAETRVGKKLSDMTTRRVIILVLIMLFVMPLFSPAQYGYDDFQSSGDFAAELVYERFRSWCLKPNSTSPEAVPWCLQGLSTPNDDGLAEQRYEERAWYEDYLLKYIYQHHIGRFAWQLYWVGLRSSTLIDRLGVDPAAYIGQLAQLNQASFLGSRAQPFGQLEWDKRYIDSGWPEAVSELPETVQQKLTVPWEERCYNHYGVSVASELLDMRGVTCPVMEELRCQEMTVFLPLTKSAAEDDHLTMMFIFDIRGTTQLAAGLSIVQTIFICFAVGIGAMTFSADANKLLLKPIERMIAKMETIKDNPLEAMKLGDIEYRREEIEAAKRREELAAMGPVRKFIYRTSHHFQKVKEPMETVILEKTIIKLGGLLALGFGEAGAEIIGANMRGGASAGVNAMVPGSKVDAIIGFCNIRSFGDATEVLKEKVMVFVNQIGEIVHGCVDDYHGAPNKNIGDCFLLVWRLSGAGSARQTKLADMAVMSFVRIVAEINKSRVLAAYREHPGLLQRIKKYRVEMGFGLHCGWAIEGAIGSEFKIDASYLSPNVNVASRLEAATEQFGVWLLISHFMISLCSADFAGLCRLIDHVTVKGSKQPIRLYTLDLDYMALEVQPKKAYKMKNRFKLRQLRELRKNEKWSDDYCVWEAFNTEEDLLAMRRRYSTEFFQRFAMAYRNYEAGEWMVARDMLFTCHYGGCEAEAISDAEDDWPQDGPTIALLKFMRESHYCPPNEWAGHRELTQK